MRTVQRVFNTNVAGLVHRSVSDPAVRTSQSAIEVLLLWYAGDLTDSTPIDAISCSRAHVQYIVGSLNECGLGVEATRKLRLTN
jgi:hypothetical protein